ncbi:MAG: DUF5647 family protein [bacterium]
MSVYSKINSMLGFEFQNYLIAHPHIADKISPNTLVVFQIDGDDKFNKWSIETSLKNKEKDQPMVKISLKKWREESLLEDLEISKQPEF